MKLNLGCGTDYQEGYVNVDMYSDSQVDARFDISAVPYEDNSVDEIRAYHVIEHFDYKQAHLVLKEWHRVLKPGGTIRIETPDFLESCKDFITADEDRRWKLYGHFFSEAWRPGFVHKFLFIESELHKALTWAGFTDIVRLEPTSGYLAELPANLFLNMQGTKR